MSRHEGVSCDSCLKGNFRGRRYKCLICYDYDLCSTCYESGATTTRHTTDHPMQCILTRTDFDLYYGGEALTAEQPQAFTCPYCGKMGHTETSLQEHVTADHTDSHTSAEVVCPICAALPGGDPNHVTDDFAAHLTLEHRSPRDFDETAGLRHVRRIPHPSRGVGATRNRRTTMHFSSAGSTLTGLSPSGRETMDPIAELLSQLSSVRSRAAAAQSVSSQLQQLEMQLQSTRQQLERLPRRSAESTLNTVRGIVTAPGPAISTDLSSSSSNNNNTPSSQFLLARCTENTENGGQSVETEKLDRGLFVQELLLSTLTEHLQLGDFAEWISSIASETEPESRGSKTPASEGTSTPVQNSASSAETVESKRPVRMLPHNDTSSQAVKRKSSTTTQASVNSGVVQSVSLPSHQAQVLVPGPAVRAPVVSSGQSVHPGQGSGAALGASPQSHVRPSPTGIRDPRMNPTASKRNMLKHVEATKKSEPPPH